MYIFTGFLVGSNSARQMGHCETTEQQASHIEICPQTCTFMQEGRDKQMEHDEPSGRSSAGLASLHLKHACLFAKLCVLQDGHHQSPDLTDGDGFAAVAPLEKALERKHPHDGHLSFEPKICCLPH